MLHTKYHDDCKHAFSEQSSARQNYIVDDGKGNNDSKTSLMSTIRRINSLSVLM